MGQDLAALPALLSCSEGLQSNVHIQRATLVKRKETHSVPCPLFNEMHCAHRLKSEPWLNLNLLFWSAYLVCHFLIHLPSFFLPGRVRQREVWLKVTYTGAVELVQAQPCSMCPASSFQETPHQPHHSTGQNGALGPSPSSPAVSQWLVLTCNGKINR